MRFNLLWGYLFQWFDGFIKFFSTVVNVLTTSWQGIIDNTFGDVVSDILNGFLGFIGINPSTTFIEWILFYSIPLFVVYAIVKFFVDLFK